MGLMRLVGEAVESEEGLGMRRPTLQTRLLEMDRIITVSIKVLQCATRARRANMTLNRFVDFLSCSCPPLAIHGIVERRFTQRWIFVTWRDAHTLLCQQSDTECSFYLRRPQCNLIKSISSYKSPRFAQLRAQTCLSSPLGHVRLR